MKKNAIVSLADSNYFDLLNELIDSIKQFKESSSTAICILDAGLKEDQLKILASKVDEIQSEILFVNNHFHTIGITDLLPIVNFGH